MACIANQDCSNAVWEAGIEDRCKLYGWKYSSCYGAACKDEVSFGGETTHECQYSSQTAGVRTLFVCRTDSQYSGSRRLTTDALVVPGNASLLPEHVVGTTDSATSQHHPPSGTTGRRLDDDPYSRFPGDARDSRALPNVQQIFVVDFNNDGKMDLFLHAPALSPGSCAQRCHSLGRFGARQPHLYTLLGP